MTNCANSKTGSSRARKVNQSGVPRCRSTKVSCCFSMGQDLFGCEQGEGADLPLVQGGGGREGRAHAPSAGSPISMRLVRSACSQGGARLGADQFDEAGIVQEDGVAPIGRESRLPRA